MTKAIFGVHVAGQTQLSLKTKPNATIGSADPVLTISSRIGNPMRVTGRGEWRAALAAGDYIVQLDGQIEHGIDIDVSPAAVFISLAGPTSTNLTSWTGTRVTTVEEKDPWPPPIVAGPNGPVAVSTLAGAEAATWFNTVLAPLANTIGRGAVDFPPIHALVIGIDNYPPATSGPTLFNSLGGCVRDALEVDAFLRDRLGVPESQITRLLAPLPGVDAKGAKLPTYENIVREWKRLIAEVPRGEQIYIHYSGHGGRVKTCLPKIKGASARDEALAPCDVNQRDTGRFLRDVEIARLLELMEERKQVGTIVLDACHSGGATKGDAVPRCGLADDLEPRKSDALGSDVAKPEELEATAQRSAGSRGVEDAWHFAPGSTTVVAACQQNEYAYEYAFDGTTRRGALTYFWLETLDRRGPSLTYDGARRRIDAAITAHRLAQRPMVLGDATREILGLDHVQSPRTIHVKAVEGDRITLSAGMATLMRRGMRLAIAPPDAVANTTQVAGLPEVEITEVGAATSIAKRIAPGTGAIVAGAQAIPLRYTDSVTRFVKWLPSGLPGDKDARRSFEQALDAEPLKLVATAPDDTTADYFVTLTADGGAPAYRIDDATGRPVARLGPSIAVADNGAAAQVVARLAHLARYCMVQTLENSDSQSPLTGCFDLEILALPDDFQPGDRLRPQPFPAGRSERLSPNTWFCLRLRNRSPFELRAVVYDLQPDWGVSKAVPRDMPFIQLAPDGFLDTPMRAWLPEGCTVATDTLKAIATVEPTDFDWLCMDALGTTTKGAQKGIASSNLRDAMEVMRSATRNTKNVAAANVPTLAWTTVQRVVTVAAPNQASSATG